MPKNGNVFSDSVGGNLPEQWIWGISFLETNHLGFDDSLLPMPVTRLGRSLTGHWRTSSSPDGLILGYWIPTGFHDIHSFSSDCAGFPSWDAKLVRRTQIIILKGTVNYIYMELHYLWWSNIGYVAILRGHNWVAVPPWGVHCWCHQASKAPPNWSY